MGSEKNLFFESNTKIKVCTLPDESINGFSMLIRKIRECTNGQIKGFYHISIYNESERNNLPQNDNDGYAYNVYIWPIKPGYDAFKEVVLFTIFGRIDEAFCNPSTPEISYCF
jgi:hypothetical protein